MQGTVVKIAVVDGQSVEIGDLVIVLEAMKMEHKITSAGAATVSEVRFAVGDRVDQGDLLVALEMAE